MTRHIRHIRARADQWVRIHRSAPSAASFTSAARVPALILLVAIVAGLWLAYRVALVLWVWFGANWHGFVAGLLVVTAITIYAQRPRGSR